MLVLSLLMSTISSVSTAAVRLQESVVTMAYNGAALASEMSTPSQDSRSVLKQSCFY